MAYIGRGIENFSQIEVLDNITFTDSAGPYNILKGAAAFVPSTVNSLLIEVDGIIQAPASYTISGSTITFGASMASTSTMNSMIHFGTGLISTPADGTVTTAKIADDAITSAKIVDGAITGSDINSAFDVSAKTVTLPASVAGLGTGLTNAQLAGSIDNTKLSNSSITINGSGVALGGSVTIGETKPTITSISPTVIENTQTSITITGTNYVSVPYVDLINSSTGAITSADSVTFTTTTSLTITATLPIDGTYFIRIENNDGNAVRSTTALLTVSDAPAWVTTSGSVGSFSGGSSIGTVNLTATDSTGMTLQSGSFPGGVSLTSAAGTSTLTGTESGSSATTTYNFTIRATDAEAQTADRAFSITITHGLEQGMAFI